MRALEQPAVRRRRAGHAGMSCRAPRPPAPWSRRCPWCCSGPRLRIIEDSDRMKCSSTACPRGPPLRAATHRCRTRGPPQNVPVSIGPPGITTAGRSTDAAAISNAGIVLSQPPSSTTPSIGLARSISSVAIAAMLRHSIAVGRDQRLAERDDRQVQRDAAGLVHALLDALRHLVQVRVAGREVRGGVRDRDVRATVEGVIRAGRGASTRGEYRRCGQSRRTTGRCAGSASAPSVGVSEA